MAKEAQLHRDSSATRRARCEAFTLVEIMIVVAVIGLITALVMPNMASARKRSQGQRIVQDAGQLNTAISEWALENNMQDGAAINTTGAATYLKASWPKKDVLGNNFKIGTVGTNQITISKKTKKDLAGVGIDWGPY